MRAREKDSPPSQPTSPFAEITPALEHARIGRRIAWQDIFRLLVRCNNVAGDGKRAALCDGVADITCTIGGKRQIAHNLDSGIRADRDLQCGIVGNSRGDCPRENSDAFKKYRRYIDRQIGDAVLGVSVVYVKNRGPVNVLTKLAAEFVQRNLRIPLSQWHYTSSASIHSPPWNTRTSR